MKRYWLKVLSLVLLTSLPGFASASPLSDLEDVLQQGLPNKAVVVEAYDGIDRTMAKIANSLAFISRTNPQFASTLRLGIGKYLGKQSQPAAVQFNSVASNVGQSVLSIKAGSYLLYDIDNQMVLAARNASVARPIASISKLFTAMVAEDVFSSDQLFAMTPSAKTVGSASFIGPNEKFYLDDALAYLLIRSSNDVANQVMLTYDSQNYDSAFVNRMNQKAAEIGLVKTHFTNPSGLFPENVSTANELAATLLFMKSNYPHLLSLSRQPVVARGAKMLESSNPMAQYPEIYRGGKNGWISASGETIAALVTDSNRDYVVVTLGGQYEDRGSDVLRLIQSVNNAY